MINLRLVTISGCWLLFSLFVFVEQAIATIQEPDNIFYGTVAVDGVAITSADAGYNVSVRYEDEELDSYTMGESGDNGDYYVLKVPVDSIGARQPGYVRSGDILEFVVNDGSGVVLTASNMVYDRGNILRLDLGFPDADQDGVADGDDNCVNIANSDQADADNDGVGDACDDFPDNPAESSDLDGDGMGDNFENTFGLNPGNPNDAGQDNDNDGKTNLEEFLQGTDPTVADNAANSVQVPLPAWAMVLLFLAISTIPFRKGSPDHV